VTTLKRGSLYGCRLSEDGKPWPVPIERYFQTVNRYRDLAISPDGQVIYIATDPGGLTESADGGATDKVVNRGAILVFTYMGQN